MPPRIPKEMPGHETLRPYSSPPCYAHEVDPTYLGLAPTLAVSDLRRLKGALDAMVATLKAAEFP